MKGELPGRTVKEARCLADNVMEHFRRHPERSLGVVAFSEAQQFAILESLEDLRKRNPDIEPFFDESRHEMFFVKNLENRSGR